MAQVYSMNCNPVWNGQWAHSISSPNWDLYGQLIHPGFFTLPLCSLTAGISQDPRSKSLVQLLSLTTFTMLHREGTGIMSSSCYTVQNEGECSHLKGFPPAFYAARAASQATFVSSAPSLVHSAMFTALSTFLCIDLNSSSYQVIKIITFLSSY